MARATPSAAALLDLPLEVLTGVCEQLDLFQLIRVAATCKRFRHGDSGLETVDLPTKSAVVLALREQAFFGGVGIPNTRLIDCSESWVAYLARCAQQRRWREAPPLKHNLFVDAAGRLLACGIGAEVGHGVRNVVFPAPTPVAAMAGVRMRSVVAGMYHSLALGWDGRVYSWGDNFDGQLGQGDKTVRPSPALVEGLVSVRFIAASLHHSLAVTQSGSVFQWGQSLRSGAEDSLRPIIVEGFGGVRVSRVYAGAKTAFGIGEDGELFSWGRGIFVLLGHGETRNQPSPKRVEALPGIHVSSVSVGEFHALALAEDGLVYAWGENTCGALLGNPQVGRELLPRREPLPKPVEALRGVRVGNVAAFGFRSYAVVADTGELWVWGIERAGAAPLGHGGQVNCPLLRPIESLRGVKIGAVIASERHTLALSYDGSVYAWGNLISARWGMLGLGASVVDAGMSVPTPPRIPELRVTCGL
jgi:hypothetical protein